MRFVAVIVDLEEFMLPCFSKQTFGIDCPGCGIQRSLALILHGEFIAAFKMYPAIYSLLFLFGFLIFNFFYTAKHANIIINSTAIITISLILVNYLLKFI
ncbi:DUF2752 domain-containing protein [Cellulophaga baltica]|uniref:DUF2752 domain-containing protein n=1 Tax=Cellulophaga TaxID=104264 RepID=UPI001C0711F8|nr:MULTISPECIES: DUF2752 domain-containing protein [Cellulophaga]MBU2996603.1 DUF2752 domain-containing protein [Cellulophaga baltica]MDO6767997.1 DUF2752 domain-containing protein [Cellulophaga sp. 1_MG-2023]